MQRSQRQATKLPQARTAAFDRAALKHASGTAVSRLATAVCRLRPQLEPPSAHPAAAMLAQASRTPGAGAGAGGGPASTMTVGAGGTGAGVEDGIGAGPASSIGTGGTGVGGGAHDSHAAN